MSEDEDFGSGIRPEKPQKIDRTAKMICHDEKKDYWFRPKKREGIEETHEDFGEDTEDIKLDLFLEEMEDLLDPNRNVDQAFKTQLITLTDDSVISGLPRREEGELIVFANSTGAEVSVPKSGIVERRDSTVSLMPSNFDEILSQTDFQNLVAFLLDQTN